MSDSVRPHRRKPTRLPRPWDPPGKNTGVGCPRSFTAPAATAGSEPDPFFVSLQGCPLESRPMAKRPGGERPEGWGAPLHPSSAPNGAGGVAGRGAAGGLGARRAGRADRGAQLAVRPALPGVRACCRCPPSVPVSVWPQPPSPPGPGPGLGPGRCLCFCCLCCCCCAWARCAPTVR